MNFQIVQKPLPYQQIIDMAHEMKPGDCVENLPAKLANILEKELIELRGKQSVVTRYNDRYGGSYTCLLYTSPSPRDRTRSRMPSSA